MAKSEKDIVYELCNYSMPKLKRIAKNSPNRIRREIASDLIAAKLRGRAIGKESKQDYMPKNPFDIRLF